MSAPWHPRGGVALALATILALLAPLAAPAQRPAITRIGYLSTRSPGEAKDLTDAFVRSLNQEGDVEGRSPSTRTGGAASSLPRTSRRSIIC